MADNEAAPKVSVIAEVPSSDIAQDFGRPPMNPQDDELPTNVSTVEQLKDLPKECLSGITDRPLRHVDEDGQVGFTDLKAGRCHRQLR